MIRFLIKYNYIEYNFWAFVRLSVAILFSLALPYMHHFIYSKLFLFTLVAFIYKLERIPQLYFDYLAEQGWF